MADYSQSNMNGNQNKGNLDYTPISMWGYFGYQILFAIPIVGLILAIVWSISAHNINLRNYARSQFCWLIIILIIYVIVFMVAGVSLIGTGFN